MTPPNGDIGCDGRDRTGDIHFMRVALFQLSYIAVKLMIPELSFAWQFKHTHRHLSSSARSSSRVCRVWDDPILKSFMSGSM